MSKIMMPPARPEMTRAAAEALLKSHGVEGPAILGRRGYYRDTMGDHGSNDRGIYDDALCVVTPTAFVTFNANCDPSRFREGIAVLKPGVWLYRLGIHNLSKAKAQQYPALVQAAKVTVVRDGKGEDTGWFGINVHRGGYTTTSSLGCQTIHPTQWDAFYELVKVEMKRHGLKVIPYVLTQREDE